MLSHRMYGTKTYRTWDSMIQRCFNPKDARYADWGGRGITVCRDWLVFDGFYKDMGEKPHGCSIDRINNNGNYEPSNCRWVTNKEQSNNRRSNIVIDLDGESKTLMQWCEKFGVKYSKAYFQYKKGVPATAIFSKAS